VLIVPTVEFPPTILSTLQVTPLTEALNCWVSVVITTAARAGETVTAALAAGAVNEMLKLKVKRKQRNL
jgi:response regulator of citrate/malate metabolism